ncbi:MAG: hypothetical protein FWD69_01315 [Polyangiaceae bacterium]|nr:hypothetical protein [Polyangiaceae bacterium]
MKTTFFFAVSLAALVGCGGGTARTPENYRDDTAAVLGTKNSEIVACYDSVLKGTPGVGGKVTVVFNVVADGADGAGTITNVAVDKANTTAPDAVADCVVRTITGAGPINPADKRKGDGTFSYEFTPPPAHHHHHAEGAPLPPPAAK